jgi:hypothetical protein
VSKVTDFEPTRDNVAALFGPRIGQGAYRDVYQYDADKVVKYDRGIAQRLCSLIVLNGTSGMR